ncbi:MAG: flagellar basal-body rod protein FlgG [Desulfobacca sp.]|nr:flagellar basal-body rod protein FlgG [Desulfobacca sp.]
MIRSLYISATGMEAQKMNLDVIANNLANVNTAGYKRGRADFQELIYQDLRTPGSLSAEGSVVPSGIQMGLGVKPGSVQKIFLQGDFVQTGNNLDMVIEGDGFFQITKPDGTLAYTRNGAFKLDNIGRVVTSDGYALEPTITIPGNTKSISIGSDGKFSVMQSGSATPTQLGTIQLARFINPAGLLANGKSLFLPSGSSGDPIVGAPGGNDGIGTIGQGFIEMSNVNIVEEMVNMIVSQRAYEINSKAVQAADEMLQSTNNLKR